MLSELQRLSHTSCSTFSLKLLKIKWRYLYIYPREYDMAQKSAFDTRYYSTSVFIKVILLVGVWILPKWKLTPLHNSLMVKTKSGRMGFDSEWMLGNCFGNLHCKSSESGWGKSVSIIKNLKVVLKACQECRNNIYAKSKKVIWIITWQSSCSRVESPEGISRLAV